MALDTWTRWDGWWSMVMLAHATSDLHAPRPICHLDPRTLTISFLLSCIVYYLEDVVRQNLEIQFSIWERFNIVRKPFVCIPELKLVTLHSQNPYLPLNTFLLTFEQLLFVLEVSVNIISNLKFATYIKVRI